MEVLTNLVTLLQTTLNGMDSFSGSLELFLSNQDNLVLLSYVIVGAFFLLLLLGITDVVIVYKDVSDFLWSLSLVLLPVSTIFILSLLMPDELTDSYSIFWTTSQQRVVSVIGAMSLAMAVFKTFGNCIANNGLVVGLLMFVFKLCAATLCVLIILGVINKLFEKSRSVKTVLVTMIVFGLFSFFVKRLINGERVMRKIA